MHALAYSILICMVIHTAVSSKLIFVPSSPHITHLGDLSLGTANNRSVKYA